MNKSLGQKNEPQRKQWKFKKKIIYNEDSVVILRENKNL